MVDNYRHKGLRAELVETLKKKGIFHETTLNAIKQIPRHLFIENAFLEHAYQDKAFPIGDGQTISQPYTVAFQTQSLDVKKGDKILEIGTGSGYQAAVLSEIGAKVYSIERHRGLYLKTSALLKNLKYKSIKTFCGDGTKGLTQFAPYDKIIVTAGAPDIPYPLIDQLAIGGQLIIPIGHEKEQIMTLITKKSADQITRKNLGNFKFVPLIGKNGWNN